MLFASLVGVMGLGLSCFSAMTGDLYPNSHVVARMSPVLTRYQSSLIIAYGVTSESNDSIEQVADWYSKRLSSKPYDEFGVITGQLNLGVVGVRIRNKVEFADPGDVHFTTFGVTSSVEICLPSCSH